MSLSRRLGTFHARPPHGVDARAFVAAIATWKLDTRNASFRSRGPARAQLAGESDGLLPWPSRSKPGCCWSNTKQSEAPDGWRLDLKRTAVTERLVAGRRPILIIPGYG